MSYKIEFYFGRRDGTEEPYKRKHKLYDSKVAYENYWKYHIQDVERWQRMKTDTQSGLVGLVDGVVDKTIGVIPDKYKV